MTPNPSSRVSDFLKLSKAVAPIETTKLSPQQESLFRQWAKANKVADVDHPDAHYDYRGFWLSTAGSGKPSANGHYPDTFKQHGHPTFSVESQYSGGPSDGGRWNGEQFIAPTPSDSTSMMNRMRRLMLQRRAP